MICNRSTRNNLPRRCLGSEKLLASEINRGKVRRKNMNSIELFAGAGGLGLGIENSGFKHASVIERDKDSCTTVRFNMGRARDGHLKWPLHEVDVRDFNFSEFEDKVELVSGGPPCQPFSIGGKHRGFNDSRVCSRRQHELFERYGQERSFSKMFGDCCGARFPNTSNIFCSN